MVRKKLIGKLRRFLQDLMPVKALMGLLLFVGVAHAQTTTTLRSAKAPVYNLTPKDVAELVLKQSYRTQEINLNAQTQRLLLADVEKLYDFSFVAESGYLSSKFQTATSTSLLQDQQYTTKINLGKNFITGTNIGLSYTRLSDRPEFTSTATNAYGKYTEDLMGITLEQSLLANFFGSSSRALLRGARGTVAATEVNRVSNLQDLVLESIRAYWTTYVAQQTFQAALSSRTRYSKLVETVRKKTGYGYSNPGELAQAQAELEDREQKVKNASVEYLYQLEKLITLLKLPSNSEVRFTVEEDIPAPPKIEKVELEKLRPLRAATLQAEASNDLLKAANSMGYPDVALVGSYSTQGLEETADDSYSEMVGGSRPRYYVGLRMTYNFGSGYEAEYLLNKRANRDLAETTLARRKLEVADKEADLAREMQATYAIALSAKTQRTYREKAAQEVNKAYNQGRTEITQFIDVLNKYFDSEVTLSRAIGDYQTSLNEWAAFRDELIPDNKKED